MTDATDRTNATWMRWLARRYAALRAFSLPVSVLPVPLAAAVAVPPGQWRWGVLIASAVGAGLLHAAGNLLNDYFDFRSGVDRKVEGDEGRPGRLLVRGELRPADVLAEAMVCLVLAGAMAAYLIWQCGPGLLWFALVAVAALYAYTGPPLKLKYHAMGEGLIFLVFGPVLMAGAAYAQTGRLEIGVLLVSVPVGLATTAILVGNNLRDLHEDGAAGIRTLVHVAGPGATRLLYVLLVVLCVAGVAVLGAVGRLPRAVIAAPLLLALLRRPLAAVWRHERLPDIDARTAQFETVLLLALLAAVVIARTLA